MFLDIFALVVIALLLGVVIWLVVLLGNMPGEIARKRNHQQSQAITALGGGWQLREGSNYVRPDLIDTMENRTDWGELLTTPEQP